MSKDNKLKIDMESNDGLALIPNSIIFNRFQLRKILTFNSNFDSDSESCLLLMGSVGLGRVRIHLI